MVNPLVIVDFSNFAHVCWWPAVAAYKKDPKYDPRLVYRANIDGKLKTIQESLADRNFMDYELVFVEDRPSIRKIAAYPLYKANREEKRPPTVISVDGADLTLDDLNTIKKAGRYHIEYLRIGRFCHGPTDEADDTISALVNQTEPNRVIIVATTDKDLWQLINPDKQVFVYNLIKGKFTTIEDVVEEFNCQPHQIPLYKTLWGDSGDNIPNLVPRMQKGLLPLIQRTDGTLESFYAEYEREKQNLTPRARELVEANRIGIALNYDLVKLRTDGLIQWD